MGTDYTYGDPGTDDGVIYGRSGGKVGFLGKAPTVITANVADGTDAATTQTLANALKAGLVARGLMTAD